MFGGCGNTLDDFGEVLLFSFLSLARLKSILMAFIFVRQQMHQMADDIKGYIQLTFQWAINKNL